MKKELSKRQQEREAWNRKRRDQLLKINRVLNKRVGQELGFNPRKLTARQAIAASMTPEERREKARPAIEAAQRQRDIFEGRQPARGFPGFETKEAPRG